MNIKEIHQQREDIRHRIWLHTQYLGIYEEQADHVYPATPELKDRSRERIRLTKNHLEHDTNLLASKTQALIQSIDRLDDPRIQTIMARRYLKNQCFATIAAEMDFDLRWVYRLHQRGLAEGEKEGEDANQRMF